MARLMPCKQIGCTQNVLDGKYCPAHQAANSTKEYDKVRGKHDPNRKLYWTARYRRFRDFLAVRNPICVRINNGVRCSRPSNVLHHIVSPDVAPELFLTASNAVMLCENCHPGGTAGTPDWKPNVHYVPSYAGFGAFGDTNPNPY
jgi:hypothetical protein